MSVKQFYNFTNIILICGYTEYIIYISAILTIIFFYKRTGTRRWRRIHKESIEYHKFHLSSITKDSSIKQNSRELAGSMLWVITKQLSFDINEGKGGHAILNSLSGKKQL